MAKSWGVSGAALVAGMLPALAFPEADLVGLAMVGLVPALLLVRGAPSAWSAALRGWCAGTGFVAAVHHWLIPSLGPFALVVFPVVGLTWVPWSVIARQLLRGRPAPLRLAAALVVVPAAFVLGEVARALPVLGGPFGLLGSSQEGSPLLGLAAVGGVWLVGFVAVAMNVCVAAAALPGVPGRGRLGAVALAGGLFALGPLSTVALRPNPPSSPQRSSIQVAGIQVGVVRGPAARLSRHLDATAALAGSGTDLIVWGESSVGRVAGPKVIARIVAAARDTGSPLLVNVDARRGRGGGGIFKTSVLIDADGVVGRYDKTRLVPFGEYVPLRAALGWLARVSDAAEEDRRRGDGPVLLALDGLSVGPLICFESAFPDLARDLVSRGADLLVVQSATTTFQDSWGQAQHAALAAVRAAETGRPVIHVALSGVSAVFDARGRRLVAMGGRATGAMRATLPLGTGTTPYVRFGDWVPLGSALAVGGFLAGSGTLRHRRSVLEVTRERGSNQRHHRGA
ncbi:MAG: apolipoprotein N-acyltransferase [Acidimicrobiia bacterium]